MMVVLVEFEVLMPLLPPLTALLWDDADEKSDGELLSFTSSFLLSFLRDWDEDSERKEEEDDFLSTSFFFELLSEWLLDRLNCEI